MNSILGDESQETAQKIVRDGPCDLKKRAFRYVHGPLIRHDMLTHQR